MRAASSLNHPERSLQLIGITGTNGKTTTTYLVESVLAAAGILSGVFGTIEYRMGGKTKVATNTTPESLDLLTYFAELVKAGWQGGGDGGFIPRAGPGAGVGISFRRRRVHQFDAGPSGLSQGF